MDKIAIKNKADEIIQLNKFYSTALNRDEYYEVLFKLKRLGIELAEMVANQSFET